MSEHLALYRKYRPQTFAEVRDQEHIIKVLEGAVKKGEVPHALLFSGTRGTGKTTLARIFAKEIGTKEVDLYEIDAASNRGIDDIRELKEAVHTVPYESKYKIYIIDEVHMLTKEAFNALLKTLEEPPAHVVFILATTEEEKLLDTILSRCLVFRFHAPSREVLADVVMDVSKKESFSMSKEAADLVAIAADGSFRDALGITQKVIMASGDKSGTADEVAEIIGAPKQDTILDLVQAFHTKDLKSGLDLIEKISTSRADAKLLFRLLLEYVRAVMLVRNQLSDKDRILGSYNEAGKEKLADLASSTPSSLNSHLLLRLIKSAEDSARSPLPYLPLEIVLLEVCGE